MSLSPAVSRWKELNRYLGDGVYVGFNGFKLKLYTCIEDKHIYLSLEEIKNLISYAKEIYGKDI